MLLRELRAQGYTGSYTILKSYLQPLRLRRAVTAAMRFETKPGEQVQVDFGRFPFLTAAGQRQWRWGFVMVLAWSRALYVEFVRRADMATFLRGHLHAFEAFGGVPHSCPYDRTKVVVLRQGAEGPHWNATFLDFALRVGFDARLCRPYRAQTKGRVESGIKSSAYNFWPTAQFVDLIDLNRQAQAWTAGIANLRMQSTTGAGPADRLGEEHAHLLPVPSRERVQPFLRDERVVGRDGFVAWDRAWYGVPWRWASWRVRPASGASGTSAPARGWPICRFSARSISSISASSRRSISARSRISPP